MSHLYKIVTENDLPLENTNATMVAIAAILTNEYLESVSYTQNDIDYVTFYVREHLAWDLSPLVETLLYDEPEICKLMSQATIDALISFLNAVV